MTHLAHGHLAGCDTNKAWDSTGLLLRTLIGAGTTYRVVVACRRPLDNMVRTTVVGAWMSKTSGDESTGQLYIQQVRVGLRVLGWANEAALTQ